MTGPWPTQYNPWLIIPEPRPPVRAPIAPHQHALLAQQQAFQAQQLGHQPPPTLHQQQPSPASYCGQMPPQLPPTLLLHLDFIHRCLPFRLLGISNLSHLLSAP
jgi:hypothetical protein